MKYCAHCGEEIMDEAVVCPHCGCATGSTSAVLDEPSTGLNVLSFFIPLVGLILFLVYHDKQPKRAAGVGKWALIGLIVSIVLNAILLAL